MKHTLISSKVNTKRRSLMGWKIIPSKYHKDNHLIAKSNGYIVAMLDKNGSLRFLIPDFKNLDYCSKWLKPKIKDNPTLAIKYVFLMTQKPNEDIITTNANKSFEIMLNNEMKQKGFNAVSFIKKLQSAGLRPEIIFEIMVSEKFVVSYIKRYGIYSYEVFNEFLMLDVYA